MVGINKDRTQAQDGMFAMNSTMSLLQACLKLGSMKPNVVHGFYTRCCPIETNLHD